jgi:lipopolysaccharide transport system permease protein
MMGAEELLLGTGFPGGRLRPRNVIRPARPFLGSVPADLKVLVRYAGLLRAMTATRLKIRYRESMLGWLWAVLQPLALMLLYVAVFSHIAAYNATSMPYSLFVTAGLLPWSFCSTAMSAAAGGMLSHQPLMTKVYFPREIVPFSYVAAASLDFLIAFLVMLGMMLCYGVPLSPRGALFVIPVFALVTIHAAALCLGLCALQVRVRDINVVLPLVLQVLMFTAPIVYSSSAVPQEFRSLYWLNPLTILVDAFRRTVLEGDAPDMRRLLYCSLTGGLSFLLAYWAFKRLEAKIVDEM